MAKDKLKMRLDFGAVKIMKRDHGVNFFGLDGQGFADPDVISAMVLACVKRGGGKLTEDELDGWTMTELADATTRIGELVAGFMAEQKDGDKGNAEGQS